MLRRGEIQEEQVLLYPAPYLVTRKHLLRPQVITGGNGTQDGTLLGIQVLTRHLGWEPKLLPMECAMQQVVGNLTHHDLIQRGKQHQELLHDEVTVPGGREPDKELEGVEVGRSARPGPGQFVVGNLH